jgi:hypothetical protein
MNKNIAFVSIFDLTQLFYEVAKRLADRGHNIYWITTNEYWTDWLMKRGVLRADILQLVYSPADFVDSEEKARLTQEIVRTEEVTDLNINQVLQMDQFVRYKNKPDINEYVLLYYRDIKRFLQDKKISLVFAEPTNTNEMVTYMICRELGIPFLAPRDMRYPLNRLIFNEGYLQSRIISNGNNGHTVSGRELLEQFEQRRTPPYYFAKNSRIKALDPRKLWRSTRNRLMMLRFSRRHLTHHDFSERVLTTTKRIVNGFYLRRLCRYDRLEEIPGRLAFYPLHVQPESSIDVLGSYFSDQLKLIKDIRRALPFDTTLVVKEHPNFLGLKSIGFFRQLRRIPNVKLVRHDVSNFDIYKRVSIVFTVSGTPAYEAGMLGIPAVIFTRMYFDGLSAIHYCDDVTKLKPLVFHLLNGFKRDYEADSRFMEELFARSHEGHWTDPRFDPGVLEQDNLEKVTRAFVKVVENDTSYQCRSRTAVYC